jgi:hypothetical protein
MSGGGLSVAKGKAELGKYITLAFILFCFPVASQLRCVFRFVEYTQGYDRYLASHEVIFYLLDALSLALAMGVFM